MEDLRLEDILMEYQFTKIINTPWKEMSALLDVLWSGTSGRRPRDLEGSSDMRICRDKNNWRE